MAMYAKGETTGSNKPNRQMVGSQRLDVQRELQRVDVGLLYDPQTSGGLLLSLPSDQADALLQKLHSRGVEYAVKIGEVTSNSAGIVVV